MEVLKWASQYMRITIKLVQFYHLWHTVDQWPELTFAIPVWAEAETWADIRLWRWERLEKPAAPTTETKNKAITNWLNSHWIKIEK